ncbi:MAG: SDR family oxidoreductase [Saprospiraceae bacterium]
MDDRQSFVAISGGTKGIGRATAALFAEKGWQVAVCARHQDDLAAMQQHWALHYPSSHLYTHVTDLSTPEGCYSWAQTLQHNLPPLDALVLNAGTFAPGTLMEGNDQQLQDFLSLNLMAPHYLTREVSSQWRQQKRAGHLVTISSIAATDWPEMMTAYALSKYALEGWHEAVSRELQPHGIRTTLIRPGGTYTSSWDGVDVDPATLLSPEQVAQWVWQAVALANTQAIEHITLRPTIHP